MRKHDLDHLLEAAVAKALGVKMPANKRRSSHVNRKPAHAGHEISRAA
jgi:hypothetical protein